MESGIPAVEDQQDAGAEVSDRLESEYLEGVEGVEVHQAWVAEESEDHPDSAIQEVAEVHPI